MSQNWTGTIPVENPNVFSELENTYGIEIPDQMKEFIQKYNAGKVHYHPYIYNLHQNSRCVFSGLLSFNKNDFNNVFSVIETLTKNNTPLEVIPFGIGVGDNVILGLNKDGIYVYDKDLDLIGNKKLLCRDVDDFIQKIESSGNHT